MQQAARPQPFGLQLERNSMALQQTSRNPLKAFSQEERILEAVQGKDQEIEELQKAVAVLQRKLAQEQFEHSQTRTRLGQVEAACRRLQVHKQVEQNICESETQGPDANSQDETMQGPNPHLLSQKPRDIRVHGGSGTLNKFAFGSDQLQELIEKHSTNNHVGTFSRRSSFERSAREEEVAAAKDREASRKEHWRRMNSLKNPVRDENKYDIFGNVVADRPVLPSNQVEESTQSTGLFAGLGSARVRHERTGTDLQSNAFLASSSLWRNGPTPIGAPQYGQ